MFKLCIIVSAYKDDVNKTEDYYVCNNNLTEWLYQILPLLEKVVLTMIVGVCVTFLSFQGCWTLVPEDKWEYI